LRKDITILRKLQHDHPGQYPDSTRRTRERRVRHWRAISGPPRKVFSRSSTSVAHKVCRILSTWLGYVTIAGAPFDHRLYHFVLTFSRWEYVHVSGWMAARMDVA
jgi:hypothetical protein